MKSTMLAMLLLMVTGIAGAHSGGTDADGCHAGTMEYHCHTPKDPDSGFLPDPGTDPDPIAEPPPVPLTGVTGLLTIAGAIGVLGFMIIALPSKEENE